MTKAKSTKLTPFHIFGYGVGDAGGVCTLYIMQGFLSRFLQVNMGVNAGILATMLLVWNIWDAVNDPLMGTIMDITFTKAKPGKDKFRPWLIYSIPLLTLGCISFFVVPPMMGGGFAMLAAVFVLKIVYEAGYTMMNIGMGSLLGAMATNDAERATLASARGFGSTLGGMFGGFMIPMILKKFGTGNEGYQVAAIVMSIFGAVMVLMHYFLTEERNKTTVVVEKTAEEKEAEKFKISDIVNIVTKNRAFLALVLHSICVCAIQQLGQGANSYMFIDVIGDVGIQSYVSLMSTGTMVVILTAAPILAKKWDLVVIIRTCLLVGFVAFGGLLAYCLMTQSLNGWIFAVWNAFATAMVTMSVQMQWGLVAEAIDYNEFLSGKRNEGTIYGFFSLSRRVGQTIANSATVLLIAGIGYDAALTNAGLPQADATITGIKLMVVGFPMIGALGSWLCFTFIWNINKDVRRKMADWKAARAVK